jgi:hypothetical protein
MRVMCKAIFEGVLSSLSLSLSHTHTTHSLSSTHTHTHTHTHKPNLWDAVGKNFSSFHKTLKQWALCLKLLFAYVDFWVQFHQHSTCSFYISKLRTQLFCAYFLGLYFTGISLPAQKLCIEHWWNWALITVLCYKCRFPLLILVPWI